MLPTRLSCAAAAVDRDGEYSFTAFAAGCSSPVCGGGDHLAHTRLLLLTTNDERTHNTTPHRAEIRSGGAVTGAGGRVRGHGAGRRDQWRGDGADDAARRKHAELAARCVYILACRFPCTRLCHLLVCLPPSRTAPFLALLDPLGTMTPTDPHAAIHRPRQPRRAGTAAAHLRPERVPGPGARRRDGGRRRGRPGPVAERADGEHVAGGGE